jgi:hypothetical protein
MGMQSISAAIVKRFVISSSSGLDLVEPEGWLWTKMTDTAKSLIEG